MTRLEDLTPEARIIGLQGTHVVTVLHTEWAGTDAVTVTYRDADGHSDSQLLSRDDEARLKVETPSRAYGFDAPAADFRLGLEAYRIRQAALFDPHVAIHTSLIQPLPHQILAVYEEMLPRQPLRFLLADDPGAGKTIMAGLLIREMIVRGDLQRCLVIAPGSLCEQWQDELREKFNLAFRIATGENLEASPDNWFEENDLVIGRLDKFARNEDILGLLDRTHWDLIVVDEAHKMSASYWGGEKKETKRYKLGRLVSETTRHFLLMSATPHNGKEEDFQLFLGLLDQDRFEGKPRDGVQVADPADLMRRLTKESLLKFDGMPLFPRREAHVVDYELSTDEAELYSRVTTYVKEEFNRADQLDGGRKGTVGFALTVLQRRLASSPEAIYQSLRRRRERLASQLREMQQVARGESAARERSKELEKHPLLRDLKPEDFDDLDDLPGADLEDLEEEVVDAATAARTIPELEAEIATLKELEELADHVRRSGRDTKWTQLRDLLQDQPEFFHEDGRRRKLVVFTEHRDTLDYLARQIRQILGREEAVVTIAGNMPRAHRRNEESRFKNDKDALVLLATDAAGEGINLQVAHLMVNYDLPWNPNRLEQRFGRIHRIGQTEVCHLWNLVAGGTREGDVYLRLLEKLEVAREALGGQVFDVLGQVFTEVRLQDLILRAIRTDGDLDAIPDSPLEEVDRMARQERIRELTEQDVLARDVLDMEGVRRVRDDMERAALRRLQPHYVRQFFEEALEREGGRIRRRAADLYEITHVPQAVRLGTQQFPVTGPGIQRRYERVTFEKGLVEPGVEFVCPGHPLFDVLALRLLEQARPLLKQGSILVDPREECDEPYLLITLEHDIVEPTPPGDTGRQDRVISRQVQFVRRHADGRVTADGFAPHRDLLAPDDDQLEAARALMDEPWLAGPVEKEALHHAIAHLVPEHKLAVVPDRLAYLDRLTSQVRARLTSEITHWDARVQQLRDREAAGKSLKMNVAEAERRRDELIGRLESRLSQLDRQKQLRVKPPQVQAAALVVPASISMADSPDDDVRPSADERARIDRLAVDAVLAAERALGRHPTEMPHHNPGYDIESRVVDTDGNEEHLLFIEVKGKAAGQSTVCVSANQINQSFNCPDQFVLAIVQVDGDTVHPPRYIRRPFDQKATEQVASKNFRLDALLANATPPC